MAHRCGSEGSSRNVDIAIDIPLVTSMEKKLESFHSLSGECCIYSVPKKLRKINEAAYTPLKVSIGPLHHRNVGLQAMEEHKWRYLQNFLKRTNQKGLAEFVKFMQEKEEKVRQCYAETIDHFGKDEFVKIILVDAAFIVEVLLTNWFRDESENDPIFGKPWMITDINRDLMLLENQLPFFILKDLFEKANITALSSQYEGLSITKLARKYLNVFLELEERNDSTEVVKHFIDFLRICLKPPSSPKKAKKVEETHLCCATELDEARIKFRPRTSKHINLTDIEFKDGFLEIPHLKVTDDTECLLRNVLAFEQCHYEACYISDYVALMDGLINTSKDVGLLVRSKVIGNWLGDDEDVSTLFNKLGREITMNSNEFHFSGLQEQLEDYCKNNKWPRWEANLRRDYLRTPWKVISTTPRKRLTENQNIKSQIKKKIYINVEK